jgi:heat shock protein HtpX
VYSEIAANKRKTWLIMFLFIALIAGLAWFLSTYWLGEPSLTFVIIFAAAVYAGFSYFGGSKMAMTLNGGVQVTDTKHRLYKIVENLAITNGMPMPQVYLIEDPAYNAFATGRDPQHAMVAATTGIVAALTDAELEGVMAHELGHVKNYDIRLMMIVFALVAVVALISDIFLRSLWFGDRDKGGGVMMLVGIVMIVLAPIAAQMIKLSISRKREYLADATGVLTTRYPEGLASALEKIQANGSALKRQNTATAHLFFANPLKKGAVSSMFSTHPPIDDRIAKLREMETKL